MIEIAQNDYLEKVKNIVKAKAPYQPVLLIYDFTTPASLVDELNQVLKTECVLTKYLTRDTNVDDFLHELVEKSSFRLAITIGQEYAQIDIETVFIPTSYNCLSFINFESQTIVIPDIINANISNQSSTAFANLVYIENALIEQIFHHSILNDKSICFELNQIINIINNFYIESSNLNIDNFIIKYFEIIINIHNFLLKNNENIDIFNINQFSLQDLITIEQIYLYTFINIKCGYTQIFDVYKMAKKFIPFSKSYFKFINYFYSLCADNEMHYAIKNYCNNFIQILQNNLRAINSLKFISSTSAGLNMKLAQEMLKKNIDTNKKTLLAYSKLLNII